MLVKGYGSYRIHVRGMWDGHGRSLYGRVLLDLFKLRLYSVVGVPKMKQITWDDEEYEDFEEEEEYEDDDDDDWEYDDDDE